MKIFIDSAMFDEIEQAYSYGILDGVTTNSSLIKKAVDALKKNNTNITMDQYIKSILKTARGSPVSLEVTEFTYEKMVAQGKALFKKYDPVAKNVVIKVPVSPAFELGEKTSFDGIKTIRTLSKSKIPVNCTLIFTPEQALLAAKAGATYVSPFAGRVDDYLRAQNKMKFEKPDYFPQEGLIKRFTSDNGIVSGIDLVKQIVDIYRIHNIKTEVLAASLRNARQVRESSLAGAHAATLPLYVIKELLDHHKTREGMKGFTKDVVPEYVKLI